MSTSKFSNPIYQVRDETTDAVLVHVTIDGEVLLPGADLSKPLEVQGLITLLGIAIRDKHLHAQQAMQKSGDESSLLDQYNQWRFEHDLAPIQQHTLRRYLDGGKGYEAGPPRKLIQFLRTKA